MAWRQRLRGACGWVTTPLRLTRSSGKYLVKII
jgi:hypothetical protein